MNRKGRVKRVNADPRCHEFLWVECCRPDAASSSQVMDHWCSLFRAFTSWKRAFHSIGTNGRELTRLEDNAFDAVICRLGLMLIPNRKLALREIRRVLKPSGKLAALVWSAPENNPLFSLSLAILLKYARGASSHLSDPFALSDPIVFERELTEAGFDGVRTHALPFQSHYASLDAFLQSTASRLAAGVMGQLRFPEQQHLLGEVREALSQFEGSHGLVAPAELLLGVGSK